jgi:hypothetical protein
MKKTFLIFLVGVLSVQCNNTDNFFEDTDPNLHLVSVNVPETVRSESINGKVKYTSSDVFTFEFGDGQHGQGKISIGSDKKIIEILLTENFVAEYGNNVLVESYANKRSHCATAYTCCTEEKGCSDKPSGEGALGCYVECLIDTIATL